MLRWRACRSGLTVVYPRSQWRQVHHLHDASVLHSHDKCVGAHISASGGCLNAIESAKRLGPHAHSFSFFIRPRLSWRPVPPISEDHALEFRRRIAEDDQFRADKIVVHGSYILNFGSHDKELREKSVELMIEEVSKCQQLGIQWYVFHPGSCTRVPSSLQWKPPSRSRSKQATTDRDPEDEAKEWHARTMSLEFISECMNQVLHETQDVTLLVENMCGQGNVLGRNFQELRSILDGVASLSSSVSVKQRVGVCLDTCHAFASGYSLTNADECEAMLQLFQETMGPDWPDALKVVHVNDSMDKCGSRRDRHENIGFGTIGLAAFQWLMNHPAFDNLPLILETPRRGRATSERLETVANADQRSILQFVEDSDESEIELLTRLIKGKE